VITADPLFDGTHGVFNCYQLGTHDLLDSIPFNAKDAIDTESKLQEAESVVINGKINTGADVAAVVLDVGLQADLAAMPGPDDVLLGEVAAKAIGTLFEKTGVKAIWQAGKYIFEKDGNVLAEKEAAASLGELYGDMVAAGNWQSFKSFGALKQALGPAGPGMEWHHIIEQSQEWRFGTSTIQCTQNVIAVPSWVNSKIASIYSSIRPAITGSSTLTVRDWLRTQSYQDCRAFGITALQNVENGVWQ